VREVDNAVAVLENSRRTIFPESWLTLYDGGGPGDYWLSRFSMETCQHFRLGRDPISAQPTYPLRANNGRVLGVVKRSLSESKEDGPKYKYPFGVDVSHLLFGYHEADSDDVMIVEGATDAIAAWEVGEAPLALYGSRISWHQRKLIYKYAPRTIWVATDQDREGHRLAEDLKMVFPTIDVRRLRWDGVKDLASIPRDLRAQALAQSKEGKVASVPCASSARTPRLSHGSFRPRRLQIKRSAS
jgi:5S rRNA maturation endonuclease (ribonuclease M5)